ncbi:MAG: glycoside hydrolase family 99-like domain-containing protein [Chthoniobacterales bacterium]|nr:glycoside hydrolase family 99-like domain-containing protein [Chthoniobacterales bacterium]
MLGNVIKNIKNNFIEKVFLKPKQLLSNKIIIYHIKKSNFFNEEWYLQGNQDVADVGMCPVFHYVNFGWLEGRDPHPMFSTNWYLANNQDVAINGINPLYHYYKYGQKEGRKPHWNCNFLPLCKKDQDSIGVKEFTLNQCDSEVITPSQDNNEILDPVFAIKDRNHYINLSKEKDDSGIIDVADCPRLIAIYLPQFHEIKENNEWWGKGFTEWTNTKRGLSFYDNHYQPHEPHSNIGYYDLDDETVLEKQASLAQQYGIYGFCYYYYWFDKKRLLQKPIDRLLKTGKPNFPFCFCWANENWTRTWDGGATDILIEQKHSVENDEQFILDLIPAFSDPRYIKVNKKPLVIIYRPILLPDIKATTEHWRKMCREANVGEIYLAYMRSFEMFNPCEYGFDAAIQFPPANIPATNLSSNIRLHTEKEFSGYIYDVKEMVEYYSSEEAPFPLVRSVCPSWDNTARRMERATSWIHATPANYYNWLCNALEATKKSFEKEERFVFINAWNEWGEGCHLEPDKKYGYAWLNATKRALMSSQFQSEKTKNSTTRLQHLVVYQERWMLLEEIFSGPLNYEKYSYFTNYTRLFLLLLMKGVSFFIKENIPYGAIKNDVFSLEKEDSLSNFHFLLCDNQNINTICFVILQYNQVNATRQCIDSLRQLNAHHSKLHFVIVDNKSNSEAIEETMDLFRAKDITIIFNQRNYGYARGNNIGYRFAKEKIKAEFIIIINNDIIIEQKEFITCFLGLYKTQSYSILGPDIIIPDGRHENPLNNYIYNFEEWQALKKLYEQEKNQYLTSGEAEFKKMGISSPESDMIINPILQGAVYILSPIFIQSEEAVFNEKTFLYGEELLLAMNSLLHGHLMLYSKQLRVLHEEGVSTQSLEESEKYMQGYNNAILSSGLCCSWIGRYLDSKKGFFMTMEAINESNFANLIDQYSKNILIDLLFCQPGFHGGGEYGKAIFKKIAHEFKKRNNCQLWVALNTRLYIDSWIWDYCKKYAINIIQVETFDDIVKLVNSEKFTLFFAPAIVIYTGYEYMKKVGESVLLANKKTKVIGCLHDVRDLELANNFSKITKYRQKLRCSKESSLSAKEFQYQEKRQRQMVESLKLMYQNICTSASISQLVTVSDYSLKSIIHFIGHCNNLPKICYPPIKNRPEPQPFKLNGISLDSINYALIMHAARFEKNAISAVIAFDELCSDKKMSSIIKNLKILLLGINSIDELDIPQIKNPERFLTSDILSAEHLEFALQKASFLIYPSLNEGFGSPPVEAMKYGVPSIASNISSIPEVCGNAVIYCDPYSISSIKESIIKMLRCSISKEAIQEQYDSIQARQKQGVDELVNIILS